MEENLNKLQTEPCTIHGVGKSLNCGMITPQTRLAAACRRFQFELFKSIGIFWLIEKTPWLKIKEPWNTLYKRAKK